MRSVDELGLQGVRSKELQRSWEHHGDRRHDVAARQWSLVDDGPWRVISLLNSGQGAEGRGGKGSGAACGQRPMNAQYTSEILDRVAFGGGCLWTCDTVGNRAYHRDSDHGEHAMSPRIVNIYVCIKSKQ